MQRYTGIRIKTSTFVHKINDVKKPLLITTVTGKRFKNMDNKT